jgi:hypothetical protein
MTRRRRPLSAFARRSNQSDHHDSGAYELLVRAFGYNRLDKRGKNRGRDRVQDLPFNKIRAFSGPFCISDGEAVSLRV